jgi:signal transduction histidine kinase
MKSFGKARFSWSAVVAGLAVILIVLAVLEYRWSKDVSEAASLRMHASLQSSVMAFRQDLYRELAAICLPLQLIPASNPHDRWPQYARQVQAAQHAAAVPQVMANVFVWSTRAKGVSELRRMDSVSGRFELAEWPASLQRLHEALRALLPQLAAMTPRSVPPNSPPDPSAEFLRNRRRAPWAFAESIPALAYPVLDSATNHGKSPDSEQTVDWVIVELNPAAFQKQVLAELAERHFGGPSGFVYRVAVFGGRDGGVLYSSDSDFGTRDMGADAAINLFGPPSGSIGQGPGPLLASPGRPQDQGFFRGPEFHTGFWGLVRFEPLRLSPDDRDWQLVVQHRDGSLEAAVARLRRRNLVIGFGVLLVMAATMGILIITTHRAQRLAKLQMDFVTGVSHELRTPLAVISSAADNIADGVVDNKEQLMRYGKAIKGQTRQLIQLVEQILLFAATREQRYQYQRRVLEVQEILDAAFGATAGLIHSAGVEVEQRIEAGMPQTVGDLAALSQCLQNLITNAVKYGGTNRWLGVRARAVPEVHEIQIAIEDRGSGISSTDLPRIFEPFYRSPSATAAQIRGTGLGLPLARSIAEAMGGRLTVTSEPGKGSSFVLHLPIAGEVKRADVEESTATATEAKVT